jgi:hypothetical protein
MSLDYIAFSHTPEDIHPVLFVVSGGDNRIYAIEGFEPYNIRSELDVSVDIPWSLRECNKGSFIKTGSPFLNMFDRLISSYDGYIYRAGLNDWLEMEVEKIVKTRGIAETVIALSDIQNNRAIAYTSIYTDLIN